MLAFREAVVMAVSSPSIQSARFAATTGASFYDKLNSVWHERALQIFMVIVLAPWAEHLFQAHQIYVMGWPRQKTNGLVGVWVLLKGFSGRAHTWWLIALVIQFWHHIEHLLLITQATLHHNLYGRPVPMSVLQFFFPRVELHLFYNSIVFIPMVIGMYYPMFPPEEEANHDTCTCAWNKSANKAEAQAA